MMKQGIKDSVIVVVSCAAFLVGTALTFLGLFLPPTGIIDNTVLLAAGQFLTFSAAGLGLKEYVDSRIERDRIKDARNKE